MLTRIPNFNEAEIKVAMELVNISVMNPDQKDYHLYVYENDGKIVGYHCTGKRPLTDGVYDCLLYTSPSPRDRTRSRMPSSA